MSYEETINKLSKGELKIFNDVEDIQEQEKMEKKLHLMQQQKQQELLERLKRDLINTFAEELDGDEDGLRGS